MQSQRDEMERVLKGLFSGLGVVRLRPNELWPALEAQFGQIVDEERAILVEKVGIYLTMDRHFVRFRDAVQVADTFVGNSETLRESALWQFLTAHGLCPGDEEDKLRVILDLGLMRDPRGNLVIVREAYA